MSDNFSKIKDYLTELDLKITDEDEAKELVIVEDPDNGIQNLIIDCEPPIVVLEQIIMPLTKDSCDFYKRLL